MSLDFPGKIIFVDDNEADISDTLQKFRQDGYGVKYFPDVPEDDQIPINVRLLIIDLDLDSCGNVSDHDIDLVVSTIQKIELKTKFFLIALYSEYIKKGEENWVEKIKRNYLDNTGNKLQQNFLEPINKKAIEQNLKEHLESWINENPHSGIIIEWEKLIERARDRAVSNIVNTGEIQNLIKSIENDVGKEALPREIISLFSRILYRQISNNRQITQLSRCLEKILDVEFQEEISGWYGELHFLNNYYLIDDDENICTGDIFRTNEDNEEKEFAMIITPVCDFSQNNVQHFKVIYGLKVRNIPNYKENDLDENIPIIVKKFGRDKKTHKYPLKNHIVGSIISGKGLPQKLITLHFVKDEQDERGYIHILFDFQNVGSFKYRPQWWKRVCRTDSPQTDIILQKYATNSARIGALEIPKEAIDEEKKKFST